MNGNGIHNWANAFRHFAMIRLLLLLLTLVALLDFIPKFLGWLWGCVGLILVPTMIITGPVTADVPGRVCSFSLA